MSRFSVAGLDVHPASSQFLDSIRTAEDAADAACLTAIQAGCNGFDHLPEIMVSGDATGKRILVPVRALAEGMSVFVESSYERNHRIG